MDIVVMSAIQHHSAADLVFSYLPLCSSGRHDLDTDRRSIIEDCCVCCTRVNRAACCNRCPLGLADSSLKMIPTEVGAAVEIVSK